MKVASPDPLSPSVTAELGRCLAIELAGTERDALRLRLNSGGWEPVLRLAGEVNLLPALAEAVSARRLALGIPPIAIGGRATVSRELADVLDRHTSRRTILLERLTELVRLLNAAGIEPILLKGGRSLWTGEPAWRSMRDLDLLVPGRAAQSQATALAVGYVPMPEADMPPHWHHLPNLYRADLPGWLEFHDRAAMHRADVLLPTPLLEEASVRSPGGGGAMARVLPMQHDLLYCMLHHHIGHRGDKFGTMTLKGLYEFATALSSLDGAGRDELSRLAARHPRLLAILDLWIAAAADWLNMPVSTPLRIADDAAQRWEAMKAQGDRGGNYAGVLGEFRMAAATPRLLRLPRGRTWLGRQSLRLNVLASLLAPATRNDGFGLPRQ